MATQPEMSPSKPVSPSETTTWTDLSVEDLLTRLAVVVTELADLYTESAMVESAAEQAKVEGFAASPSESLTGRDRDARAHAAAAVQASIELRGRIMALEAMREFGYYLLSRA